MRIRPEDMMFWILIALIIGLAVWKLIGSPTDTASLTALALFIAGSEILIWKNIFRIDKKTSIGFIKLKSDMDKNNLIVLSKLESIENKLRKK